MTDWAQTARMTTQPPEDDPAEVAESSGGLTQPALAKHPEALTEAPVWDSAPWNGLEDD